MRLSVWVTTLVAVGVTAGLLVGAWLVLRPGGPALATARFSLAAISPNADGDQDVTRITYTLRRPASVSIYCLDAQGTSFYFRRDQPREAGTHTVDFSGIVAAYVLPGEQFEGELLARVLQAGAYTWVIEASENSRPSGRITGPLTIAEADTTLPLLENFTVSPLVFTPNQDGLDDHTWINVHLAKDVAADGLRLALIDAAGQAVSIAEFEVSAAVPLGRAGLHQYDYDGGINLGQEPPADGTYTLRAEAEDRMGQKMVVTNTLTIKNAGMPFAEIVRGEVRFSATTLVLGQTLYFTLTVENYGLAPIRTSGPESGWVYTSMGENANTLGEYDQSGAWRVGLMCQTCIGDYPWRWAVGTRAELTNIPDEHGQAQYYLMPGQRAVVTGGVVLDKIVESRNPQYFWAGLIHEDVGISVVNNRVGPLEITIVPTD
jgi:hypothetical protein